ncbi:MAG: hypothetical protein V4687_00115 [Bacteroidota bacterium]
MKKFLTLAAVLIIGFSANKAKAQATATLNVTLAAVQSITVAGPQATVTLPFTSAADYNAGVTLAQPDHITATSTGQFFIRVKADGPLTRVGGGTIPLNTISLTPTAGTVAIPTAPTFTPITQLSTTDQELVRSTGGCVGSKINVSYRASGGAPYLDKVAGTYTALITYTIAAL